MDQLTKTIASLETLNSTGSLNSKIEAIHKSMNEFIGNVHRISVSLYDEKTDLVKTFLQSTDGHDPLPHYQAKLSETKSLLSILNTKQPFLDTTINKTNSDTHHSKRLAKKGFQTSFTFPMYNKGRFFGFIFINSRDIDAFSVNELPQLELFSHLVTLMVSAELHTIESLRGVSNALHNITYFRDVETGHHLERVSRYAREIATYVAPAYNLNDEFIEHLFLFSPLHDIGKIAIPDNILLNTKKLTHEEFELIKSHTTIGVDIMNRVLNSLNLNDLNHIDMLRNIIKYHHERWDGMGYPEGLKEDAIPTEARIIAVVDVFDALTSARPYKQPWDNETAFEFINSQADIMFDPICVEGMRNCKETILQIKNEFVENNN